ncbi:hypothetical protein Misp02_32340 [Microtetraspora sp. NBRC 16547]|nr:hypothetical protein Misp02_32340 [Microtetraspora sp. NBRC 16547]
MVTQPAATIIQMGRNPESIDCMTDRLFPCAVQPKIAGGAPRFPDAARGTHFTPVRTRPVGADR